MNFSLPSQRVCVWPVALKGVTGFFFAALIRETIRKHLTGNTKSGLSLPSQNNLIPAEVSNIRLFENLNPRHSDVSGFLFIFGA